MPTCSPGRGPRRPTLRSSSTSSTRAPAGASRRKGCRQGFSRSRFGVGGRTHLAVLTGFEPATSALTGRRALQLLHRTLLLRAPNGIRTRATALKGRRPGPLDDGDGVALGVRRWGPSQSRGYATAWSNAL